MMNDVLALYETITKGVRRMIRNFVLLFLVIVLGIIVIVIAFSNGWVQIVVTPENVKTNRMDSEPGVLDNERLEESLKNPGELNPIFQLIDYKVESGETLFDLENRFGTNWKVIQKVNKIEDPLHLKPGTVIRIPVRVVES